MSTSAIELRESDSAVNHLFWRGIFLKRCKFFLKLIFEQFLVRKRNRTSEYSQWQRCTQIKNDINLTSVQLAFCWQLIRVALLVDDTSWWWSGNGVDQSALIKMGLKLSYWPNSPSSSLLISTIIGPWFLLYHLGILCWHPSFLHDCIARIIQLLAPDACLESTGAGHWWCHWNPVDLQWIQVLVFM